MNKVIILLLVSLFVLVGCNGEDASEYRENSQKASERMLENAAAAEEILNQYAKVWSFSIESNASIPVSEMVEVTGFEHDVVRNYFEINNADNITNDFSTNIHSMVSYYEEIGELKAIKDASEEIKSMINELNEPPEGFEKVYDELLDMYTFSEEYIGMALNPDGSLQSFNEDRSQLSDDIISKIKRIEAVMPNED